MNRAYHFARGEIGVKEQQKGHNPKIVEYFREVGHGWVTDDETAWCAAFVGAMLKRADMPHTGKLNARSYLEWGEPIAIEDAREGDICVFKRGNNASLGHVAFFVRDNGTTITVLGGNQANAVNERNYSKASLIGVRRMIVDEIITKRDVRQLELPYDTAVAEASRPVPPRPPLAPAPRPMLWDYLPKSWTNFWNRR